MVVQDTIHPQEQGHGAIPKPVFLVQHIVQKNVFKPLVVQLLKEHFARSCTKHGNRHQENK